MISSSIFKPILCLRFEKPFCYELERYIVEVGCLDAPCISVVSCTVKGKWWDYSIDESGSVLPGKQFDGFQNPG